MHSLDLHLDEGVLTDDPLLEIYGWRAVERCGGLAVVPRRDDWLAALASGVDAVGLPEGVGEEAFDQAVVHLQKGRAATQAGLVTAWRRLKQGGRLLLVGGNDLGVKSAIKRLAEELDAAGEVLANRARGRVVGFARTDGPGPAPPDDVAFDVELDGEAVSFHSAVGVFSADRLDRGTRLLLDHLDTDPPPGRVLDLGCGVGVLGLTALRRWPEATCVLADVDRRAVEAVGRNAAAFGVADRCRAVWWDAVGEAPPGKGCDLVLINPPFHTGKAVDLDPAAAMFRSLDQVLSPGGCALIVANRTLPYERKLSGFGRVAVIAQEAGFKVLSVQR